VENYHEVKINARFILPFRKYLFIEIMAEFEYQISMEELKELTYFRAALDNYVERKGHGIQTFLAITTGLSEGHLSQVINRKKNPSFEAQVKIARALGHEYSEFLDMGENIISSGKTLPQISEDNKKYPSVSDGSLKDAKNKHIEDEHTKAVALTSRVMLSRHRGIGKALIIILEQFADAVKTKDELEICNTSLAERDVKMSEMEERIKYLENRVEELLRREPRGCSDTPGDCAPVPVKMEK